VGEMRHHVPAADVVKFYDRVPCGLLDRFIIRMRAHLSSYEIIAAYVPFSGLILDAGSGFGILSIYLALLSGKRDIRGVDISKRRIRIARAASRNIPNVSFEQSSFLEYGFEGYDCIVLMDVLHYFPDPVQDRFLKKWCRRINPGGTILIRDSNREHKVRQFFTWLHELVMTKSGFTKGGGLYFRRFGELKNIVESLGFHVSVMPMWGVTPFADTLMVAKKKRI